MDKRDSSGKRAVKYVNEKGKDDDRDCPLKPAQIKLDIVELVFDPLLWFFNFQ